MRLINSIIRIQAIRAFSKKKKRPKVKNWDTEKLVFEKRINKAKKIIKYSKSPDTLIKKFDEIKEEFKRIMTYKPFYICLKFGGINMNSIKDIEKIEEIKKEYIKTLLENMINIELAKKDEVTQPFLKEGLVKKALNHALKAIEFLPDDEEMRCRISQLEEMLLNCFAKKE